MLIEVVFPPTVVVSDVRSDDIVLTVPSITLTDVDRFDNPVAVALTPFAGSLTVDCSAVISLA